MEATMKAMELDTPALLIDREIMLDNGSEWRH